MSMLRYIRWLFVLIFAGLSIASAWLWIHGRHQPIELGDEAPAQNYYTAAPRTYCTFFDDQITWRRVSPYSGLIGINPQSLRLLGTGLSRIGGLTEPQVAWIGLQWGQYIGHLQVGNATEWGEIVEYVIVKHWPLQTLLGLPLCLLLLPGLRRSRIPSTACPTCGYDTRATPHRCPECGMLLKAKESVAAGLEPAEA